MKISELIVRLKAVLEHDGDLEVVKSGACGYENYEHGIDDVQILPPDQYEQEMRASV